MIIHNQTAPFNHVSPAPARTAKSLSKNRAAESAEKAQFSPAGKQAAVGGNNLTAVDSQIPDVDAAQASTEQARQSILGQPAMALLAQANSISPGALRLLPQ